MVRRQNASVGEADAPRGALLAARLLHQHDRRPVHVVERQPCIGEHPLPGRPYVARLATRLDALNGLRQIGFSGAKLDAASAALVARKPLLQRPLHRPLQQRVDGRAHRVGVGRDRVDAGDRFGFPGDFVDEMKPDIAARPFIRREWGQRRHSRCVLLGGAPVASDVLPGARSRRGRPSKAERDAKARALLLRLAKPFGGLMKLGALERVRLEQAVALLMRRPPSAEEHVRLVNAADRLIGSVERSRMGAKPQRRQATRGHMPARSELPQSLADLVKRPK
jgi:hypothetical protein